MNDATQYVLDSIKTWVWSGFYGPEEVQEKIDDMLEEDPEEELLRAAVAPEFEKKRLAEKSWPKETDCDRLDKAFQALNASGIVALHAAGYTISDGISDVSEVIAERGEDRVKGYCFYHGQDLERAVTGDGLMLAFGSVQDERTKNAEIGNLIKGVLEEQDLIVDWNGDPESRLNILKLDWKRRRPA